MDVWTEADASGFRYHIVCEDGSDYIRSKVFRASLETERDMWAAGQPDEGALTPANYVFEDRGAQPDGLASLAVKPRRKDMLLVDGSIFLNPDDGELVRMEGPAHEDAVVLDAAGRDRALVSAHRRFPHADRARIGRECADRRCFDLPDDLRIREHQRPARRQSAAQNARSRHPPADL